MKIRPFQLSDTHAVIQVYRDSIRRIGPAAYSPEQIAAWSRYPTDEMDFGRRLSGGYTLVAENNDRILAFGQLEPRDYIAFLYTSADNNRQGIGSLLFDALETHACAEGAIEMHAEVSRIARSFYEKRGFTLQEILHHTHFGVDFEWYHMRRTRETAIAMRKGWDHSRSPTA